jgi:hypothetical protein
VPEEREGVSDGEVDSFDVDVVFERDNAVVGGLRGEVEEGLEVCC